jgi:phosphatidylglycerophosphate synthase
VKHWLPHALSLFRLPLAFILVLTYQVEADRLRLALGIVAAAAVSDKLDGVFARKFRVASFQGYLIDGLADRTFSVACIIVALLHHNLPSWAALVATTRELLMYTCRLMDPGAWHPPPRKTRAHSLIVFGVTRMWFLALILIAMTVSAPVETRHWAECLSNATYTLTVLVSFLLLLDTLLRRLAKCFEDENS